MIITKSEHKTTRLTVCNYATYQDMPTRSRHDADMMATPIKPLNNKNNNTSSFSKNEVQSEPYYETKKNRILKGKKLESFNTFWEIFNYKRGKAEASDEWLDIPDFTDELIDKIIRSAKSESKFRPDLVISGKIPKMAAGWLTAKRWEDELEPIQTIINQAQWLS
jgi:hypothetical protein